MKKKSLSLPFKSNFFKEQDPFHLVVVFFIIFLVLLFFSQYLPFTTIKNTTNKLKIQSIKNLKLI